MDGWVGEQKGGHTDGRRLYGIGEGVSGGDRWVRMDGSMGG